LFDLPLGLAVGDLQIGWDPVQEGGGLLGTSVATFFVAVILSTVTATLSDAATVNQQSKKNCSRRKNNDSRGKYSTQLQQPGANEIKAK
jgi:hypothetical protein